MRVRVTTRLPWIIATVLTTACGSSSTTNTGGSGGVTGGAGGATGGAGGGAATLQPFTAPPADPGAKAVLFTISGEELAFTGYDFPPADMDAASFYDGWKIDFDRLLVTVDKITLSENPVLDPTMQNKTGPLVAEVDGPWAVDLHKKGPLMGMGGGDETAVPIAALINQNKNGGKAFDTAAGTVYAFGFDLVPATMTAQNVNLDADALADYQQMVTDKCAVLYSGTATFKGGADCKAGSYDFTKLPATVKFKFCLKSPTSYVNCQNGSAEGMGVNGEEKPRGFAFKANASVIAQVTVHTDHPFWDSTDHDSPARFDEFAARVVGAAGPPTVTLNDAIGVDFTGITDKNGLAVPVRTCRPAALLPAGFVPPTGQLRFDPKSIMKIAATADPSTGFRDLADYTTYNQSTQGHLNSDGLCYVKRNYPSPP